MMMGLLCFLANSALYFRWERWLALNAEVLSCY